LTDPLLQRDIRFVLQQALQALNRGKPADALRWSDRACRIASASSLLRVLHSKILIEAGLPDEAALLLADELHLEARLVRAGALQLAGRLQEATQMCGSLLRDTSCDSLDGLSTLAGQLISLHAAPGWCGLDAALRLTGAVTGEAALQLQCGDLTLPLPLSGIDEGVARFQCALPVGLVGTINLLCGDRPLLGSGFHWPPDYAAEGWVVQEGAFICGEIRLGWTPARPMILVVRHPSTRLRHVTIPASPDDAGQTPFAVSLAWLGADNGPVDVSLLLPSGDLLPLIGSPLILAPARAKPYLCEEAKSPPPLPYPIDIIVPVYGGRQQSLKCVERVLASTDSAIADIVVVDDASPDRMLIQDLTGLAQSGRITLISNAVNLGFAGSVNRALALHPDRDVVLLNADTEVFGDWPQRLRQAAYSASDIATVTPLGTDAAVVSYPGAGDRDCSSAEAEAWDEIAASVNRHVICELPVGVGFCLYIRRACLDQIGGFDAETFGMGYGEDNDFCLRARDHGWRHVAAANVFVRHEGGASFGPRKHSLMARHRHILNALYPGYDQSIAAFLADDPLRPARRAIDEARLRRTAVRAVLLISLSLPGGVERHVEARRQALAARGHTVLILRPSELDTEPNCAILSTGNGRFPNLIYELPDNIEALLDFLWSIGLVGTELHHMLGHDPGLWPWLRDSVPYDIYVHDYSWLCPRITLLGGDDSYCGEPPIESCERCVATHGTSLRETISVLDLRSRSAALFAGASNVIVPTHDVRERLARYFPTLEPIVAPWESAPDRRILSRNRSQTGRIRVAVIGGISLQKGFKVLLACAQDAVARDLPIEFVVIGFTRDDDALLATGRIFVTGTYREEELSALLDREDCDILFFPSVTPETWCYTLTPALARGLPILAFELGAIAERLRAQRTGTLLPVSTPPATINDMLLRHAVAASTDINEPSQSQRPGDIMDTHEQPRAEPDEDALTASVQLLPLPEGLFLFTVTDAGEPISVGGLVVPALHVGVAPAPSVGTVEFLASPSTQGGWLARRGDAIVVRIAGGEGGLLLTSLRPTEGAALAIEVRKIDGGETTQDEPEAPPAVPTDPILLPDDLPNSEIRLRILAHISNMGDVAFIDGGWAGCFGQNVWIEALSIVPADQISPADLEYRTVTAAAADSPFVSDSALSGSRGQRSPVTGFAVRTRGDAASLFDCFYSGRFISGVTVGPVANGALCVSTVPDDPLEGFKLWLVARQPVPPVDPLDSATP
jgi:GT2 family glycosyltransferase/glycosyltransferase involved in cell wall biosynthesis